MRAVRLIRAVVLIVLVVVIAAVRVGAARNGNHNFFGKNGKLVLFRGRCPGKTAIGYYDNIKLRYVGDTGMIDYDTHFTRDVDSTKLITKWIVERCSSKEALDSCQQMSTITASDYCKMVNKRGEIWSGLTDCIIPQLKCPFKKNIVYRGKNCSLPDVNSVKFIPLSRSYWKFRAEVWDRAETALVLCGVFEGDVK